MRTRTPAKRLHALAARYGLIIDEFSPGLRIWTIRDPKNPARAAEPLAFGVPQSALAARIRALGIQALGIQS